MEALMDMYAAVGDQESVQEINKELETLKKGCTSAKNRHWKNWTVELMKN